MVTFHTNHGDIVIKTFDDKAPETVKNFLDYCREGFLQQHHFPPCYQRLYDSGRRFLNRA
ncbi:peptidyl-prolyl cis-trans isomerase B [Escherichia coli]|nr:peptidyl-prolyl cis-trans isomerase B [Escherichia coli]